MRGGRDRSKRRTDAIGLLAKLTFRRRIGSQDAPYICRGHVLNFKEQASSYGSAAGQIARYKIL